VSNSAAAGLMGTNILWGPMDNPGVIRAVFEYDLHTIVVTSRWGGAVINGVEAPSGYGKILPWGTELTCAVPGSPLEIGGAHFVCTGWTGSGSVPLSGGGTNTGTFHLEADSSVTWHWDQR
jgi:hypothetical protein